MAKERSTRKLVYEGKSKIIYEGAETGTLIQYFKDDATAFNGEKHEVLSGKGVINNRISEFLMQKLDDVGIHTHFIKRLNMREQLIKACEMIPIEIIIRNITAGSISKRFAIDEGINLYRPMIEMCLKSDKLGDPFITNEHIEAFGWAAPEEIEAMNGIGIRVNDFLSGLFAGIGIKLVDIKLEFGRIYDEAGNIYLVVADEISPDSCRLWDSQTGNILDKDRFRRNLGSVLESYREVAKRLGIINENDLNVVNLADSPSNKKNSKKDKKK
jgi:phosphoribosylaminoimidazole-succinocarboxamide synthase